MKKFFDKSSLVNVAKAAAIFAILYFEVFFFKFAMKTAVLVNSKVSYANAVVLWEKYHVFSYYIRSIFFIFAAIICFLIIRERIMKFKQSKVNWTYSVVFIAVNLFSLLAYVILNMHILENEGGSFLLLASVRYLLILIMAFSLIFAFFGIKNFVRFVREFKYSILVSMLLSWLFLNFYTYFQKLWPYMSWVVAKIAYYLLLPIYKDVFLKYESTMFGNVYHNIPTVGTSEHAVAIFKPCSGIEGISLFLLFFSIIAIIEWKTLNKKRLFILYPLGVLFMFLINIARITFLIIAGIEISPEFAMGGFHSNFGWILFAVFFFIFMYFSYNWMKKS
ncbi:archaeosortase/exosortase family protein [Candidatus Woesearchaeota archaeon]|nr:archaeosortase/exosortase family protein [Candidatus Woesearchaeota archaeon]